MSLGLIATAIAIVRASSLGIKTADLSYDYCVAAIWANTELHLGIIATNLALSRMIWAFLRDGTQTLTSTNTPHYGNGSHLSKSRNGYLRSEDRNVYNENGLDTRGSADNLSQASQIPLDPVIKRTTSVHITTSLSPDGKKSHETLSQWNIRGPPTIHEEINPSHRV